MRSLVWDRLDRKWVGVFTGERDFIRNRALKIREKVGEIKLHIWIHQQGDVKVKVVGTVTGEYLN